MKMSCFLVLLFLVCGLSSFVSADDDPNYIFDKNTPGLVLVNNSGYATTIGGYILIQIGDSATADIAMEQGHRYKVTAKRQCLANGNLNFKLELDGTYYMWDWANSYNDPLKNDQVAEEVYLGYYEPTGPVTTVQVRDGGAWSARIHEIRFEATDDIYFDENTADLTYWGSSSPVNFRVTSLINSSMPVYADPGNSDKTGVPENGIMLDNTDSGTITGSVQLAADTVYHVYSSRKVMTNGNLSYDVSIDGTTISDATLTPTDDIYNAPEYYDDSVVENHIGEILSSATGFTNIVLDNPGIWAARVDYLRFVPAVCGDIDHAYGLADATRDCVVNMDDLSGTDMMTDHWLETVNINGGSGHNLFALGDMSDDDLTFWYWDGGPDTIDPGHDAYHVTTSNTGNGRGGTGNAIVLTDSVHEAFPMECWLNWRAEFMELAPEDYIEDNSTVYIGAWAKVADFNTLDPSVSPGLGVELRLSLGSSAKQETYWSNTNVSINGLCFGWGGPATEADDMTTDWVYYEYPCQVGDSEDPLGWSWLSIGVTDRVGHRGDHAAEWNGSIYIDDITVTKESQLPQPPGPFDYTLDGIVNLADFAVLAMEWLECTDPEDRSCDLYWL